MDGAQWMQLEVVRRIEGGPNGVQADAEWLARELKKASRGHESDLMRLLLSRVTLNTMYQFCALLDPQGTMWDVNHAALEGGGMTRSDVHGRPFWEASWWQTTEATRSELRAAIAHAAGGAFIRYDVEVYGRGGTELITIDFDIAPVTDRDGIVLFLVCEGRDVTEQRRLETEVRRQREELAQLDQLKTQFFSNISHEFRTPLTLMLGPATDALADNAEPLGPRQRQRLLLLQRNGQRMLKLVNSLLDFARIEASRMQAVYEPLDLAALTADLASSFRAAMEKAHLGFSVDCQPLPAPVHVDRDMWEKIVLNLLSNAFKFTLEGSVSIRLTANDGAAKLVVSDSGIGIPADVLPHIFDRFRRAEDRRGRSHEGSGIGLALVRELVRLHGGTIDVESRINEGTTFTVTLPFGTDHIEPEHIGVGATHISSASGANAYVTEALHSLPDNGAITSNLHRTSAAPLARHGFAPWVGETRIIVADDNADMRAYLNRLLCDAGFVVETVVDGEAALAAARLNPPDLILSDVMMPQLDGFALLRAIRSDPAIASIPFLMLSARAGEEARVEGFAAGADDYLVKPFTARELVARIEANVALSRLRRETDRRQNEERLQLMRDELAHTARLYEMGQIVSGLAHEINHPLTVIGGYADGLKQLLDASEPETATLARDVAGEISRHVQLAGAIIRRLRDFVKSGPTERRAENLRPIIDDAIRLGLAGVPKGHIALHLDIANELPRVFVDKVQIEQVLVNLVRNAREAMENSTHREIRVEAHSQGHGLISISVADTGSGIDPAIAADLFTPFVTTKPRGMGIGLPLCRDIVEAHGGKLRAEPASGGGTVFYMTLPVFAQQGSS
ncbi:MAG: hypothetical protein BGN95_11405 [Sphingomonas sp. 66-10]|uniref:ATP-binding protein n=1 Tax=Sphingomonas sp. 66-10 TaxID=1895848 RepID=UPI00092891AF|nr:ATP-binding protein [Sphingomonas sp. 66-10]OJU21222.1 MAG: hypothetical protein BGN95_11405 [Sphingomonas sp. 66-10]